jgi:hypothetical protein
MSTPIQPQPVKPGSHLAAGITAAEKVTKPKGTRAPVVTREPTMHALVRILGPEVLDIFPDGIAETVTELAAAHAADKSAYAHVVFDSPEDREDALSLMRAFTESTDDPRLSIRQDKNTDPDELRFRVVLRKGDADEE